MYRIIILLSLVILSSCSKEEPLFEKDNYVTPKNNLSLNVRLKSIFFFDTPTDESYARQFFFTLDPEMPDRWSEVTLKEHDGTLSVFKVQYRGSSIVGFENTLKQQKVEIFHEYSSSAGKRISAIKYYSEVNSYGLKFLYDYDTTNMVRVERFLLNKNGDYGLHPEEAFHFSTQADADSECYQYWNTCFTYSSDLNPFYRNNEISPVFMTLLKPYSQSVSETLQYFPLYFNRYIPASMNKPYMEVAESAFNSFKDLSYLNFKSYPQHKEEGISFEYR